MEINLPAKTRGYVTEQLRQSSASDVQERIGNPLSPLWCVQRAPESYLRSVLEMNAIIVLHMRKDAGPAVLLL
jgi:hypothetical protein